MSSLFNDRKTLSHTHSLTYSLSLILSIALRKLLVRLFPPEIHSDARALFSSLSDLDEIMIAEENVRFEKQVMESAIDS